MFNESESEQFELSPELIALERQLAQWTPAMPRLDRDRLMFEAGRANGAALRKGLAHGLKRGWFWPATATAMTAACLLLGAMLFWRNGSVNQPTNHVNQPVAATPTVDDLQPVALHRPEQLNLGARNTLAAGYVGLRNLSLAYGLGVLELRTASANGPAAFTERQRPQPATAAELLQEFLPQQTPPARTRS